MEPEEPAQRRPTFDSWGLDAAAVTPAGSPPATPGAAPAPAGGVVSMVVAVVIAALVLLRLRSISWGADDYSTSFAIGQVTGAVALLAACGWLFVRGLRRRRADPAQPVGVAPAAGVRWATVAAVAVLSLAGAGILIGLVTGHGGAAGAAQTGWRSTAGINSHVGFVDGCNQSARGAVNCECAFAKITATPPYETPAGFATLDAAVARFRQTADRRDYPAVMLTAIRSCRA